MATKVKLAVCSTEGNWDSVMATRDPAADRLSGGLVHKGPKGPVGAKWTANATADKPTIESALAAVARVRVKITTPLGGIDHSSEVSGRTIVLENYANSAVAAQLQTEEDEAEAAEEERRAADLTSHLASTKNRLSSLQENGQPA